MIRPINPALEPDNKISRKVVRREIKPKGLNLKKIKGKINKIVADKAFGSPSVPKALLFSLTPKIRVDIIRKIKEK